MAVEESGVRLIADGAQPFFRTLDQADKALSGFVQQSDGASKALARFSSASDRLTAQAGNLTKSIELQKSRLAILNEELEKTKEKYGEGSLQAKRKQQAIDSLNASIANNERRLTATQQKLEAEKRAYAESITAVAEKAAANIRVADSSEKAASATDKSNRALQQATPAAREAGQAIHGLGKVLDDAKGQFSAFEQVAIGALRRVGEMATDALVEAGRAIVDFGVSSIQVAGGYEATLNRFAAVAGDAITEAGMSLQTFDQLALQMGADTQFSAAEAAQAMVELAKGGIDPATIAATGLKGALDLAAAGELDLTNSSEILAKQLGIWASEGVAGAEVANLLSQAANASTVDVDNLALGLANAGGTAKATGVEYEDLVQTMALLAPGFSSASDAGTSLKVFLSRLIPTTKSATSAMGELGLLTAEGGSVFFDAQGNFVGMAEAAGLLQGATKDLSEEQRLLYLNTIFGQDAIRASVMLAEAGTPGFDAMGASMDKAGTAAEQAAKRNQGFNFALESLKGSVETFQIVAGRLLLPTLTEIIQGVLIPGVNAVTDFADAFFEAGGAAETLGAYFSAIVDDGDYLNDNLAGIPKTARPFVEFLGRTTNALIMMGKTIQSALAPAFNWLSTNGLATINKALSFVNANFDAFMGALLGVGAVLVGPLVLGALSAVGAALATLLSPIGLAIAAGAALGAAWGSNFMGIRETVGGFAAYLSGVFGPVVQAFQLFGQGALDEIYAFVTGTETTFSNLTVIFGTVLIAVGTLVTDIATTIISYTPTVIAAWWNFAVASWQWLLNAIPIVIDTLGQWSNSLLVYLGNNLPNWINGLLDWGIAAAQWIADAIPPMITKAGEFLYSLLTWSQTEVTPGLQEETKSWVTNLTEWVTGKLIPEIKPKLVIFKNEMVEALKKVGQAAWEQAKKIGSQIIDGIVNAIKNEASKVWNEINNLFGGATETAQEAIDAHSPSRVFMGIGQNLVSGLIAGITGATGATSAIVTLFDSILAASQQALGRWTALLAQWGTEAWVWLQKAIPLAVQQASLWGGNLLTSLSTQFPAWVQSLMLWGLESWEWLRDSIPPLTEQMALFHMALATWASLIVLPTLKTQATAWATTLYMWIPDELIPGILPMWEWFLTDSITQMKRIEGEMYKSGKKVGSAIIKGILEAIKDGKGKIINLFIDVVNQAIAAAKRELGIASPSKVFYSIGQNMMAGLEGGILSGAAGAAQTLQAALGEMTGSASATLTLSPLMAGAGGLGAVDKPIATGLNFKPVAPPATPGQIINRAQNISNSSTTNYNLTTNTARESQGVRGDFAVMQAFGR